MILMNLQKYKMCVIHDAVIVALFDVKLLLFGSYVCVLRSDCVC